jgi:hypothetical protein
MRGGAWRAGDAWREQDAACMCQDATLVSYLNGKNTDTFRKQQIFVIPRSDTKKISDCPKLENAAMQSSVMMHV